jgi:hypothetical protein
MKVVIRKGGEIVIKIVNKKKVIFKKEMKWFRLENEIIIYEIVFGMVHG